MNTLQTFGIIALLVLGIGIPLYAKYVKTKALKKDAYWLVGISLTIFIGGCAFGWVLGTIVVHLFDTFAYV